MKLEEAVTYVANRFEYEADPNFSKYLDTWQVLPLIDDKFKGDCDDFALTCLWYYSGENRFKFLWNLLITHKYKLYRAKTYNGRWHIIGCVGDKWFDNWTRKVHDKENFLRLTKHEIKMRYYSPMFLLFLINGLIK